MIVSLRAKSGMINEVDSFEVRILCAVSHRF
jgi:hypothetical protein